MRKGKIKAAALLLAAILFLSPAVSARAEIPEEHETGAQTIVYQGEVYELYQVEKLPAVTVFAKDGGEGLKIVRTVTNYSYRSAGDENIVTGEVTNDTYTADGTLIATLKQTTEWHYYGGWLFDISPELLSADTIITYQRPGTMIEIGTGTTTIYASNTTKYTVPYDVTHKGVLYEEEICTTCDIYGRVK